MMFRAIFFALLLALIEISAKELKPGPQAIKDTASASNSTQKSQKRYATKEIILYLTPSQIKDLQSGKAYINPEPISQPIEKPVADQNSQRPSLQEHDEFVRQQFENIKNAKISNIEQPRYENLELVSQIPSYRIEDENQQKYADIIEIWKQNQAKLEEQAKSQYLYAQSEENKKIEELSSQNERKPETVTNTWIAYDPLSEKKQNDQKLDEQFKQQWNRILEQNRYQLKGLLADQKANSEKISTQTEKPLLQTQYGPRYNDQKHAIEIEQILKSQQPRQQSEKEKALARAEAIANSPPILIHQEIKVTKHRAVPVVKHVKHHVPTPVLIPVPEPFEVKVPHPYPVPLEIIKPIPVPIYKTEKIEVERPVPYEVEKQVQVPVTKKVYVNVDRPYYVEKRVPVEIKKEVPVEIPIHKAEKITILRHVWNH